MRYTIKAMLKSKTSILCMLFMLTLNLFTMWQLESKDKIGNSHDNLVQQWKYTVQNQRGFYRNAERMGSQIKGDELLKASYDEYMAMYEYEMNLYETTLAQMYETPDLRECRKMIQRLYLKQTLLSMNLYANEEEDRPYFQDVFKEEVEQFEDSLHLEEWSFDSYLLHEYGNINPDAKERYLDASSKLDYYFTILDQDNVELTYQQASPWTFLAYQMSIDSMQPLVIGMFAILYTMSWVIMLKDSGVIRLEGTRPLSILCLVMKQLGCICFSFILIVVISNLIPVVLLGINHGFQDANVPVLLYEKGLTSFQSYSRTTDDWSTLGLSSFTSTVDVLPPSPYLISEETSFCEFYIIAAISFALIVLKIMTYCWLSLGIMFWMKNKWVLISSGFVLIALFWASQSFQLLELYNPLALSQSMLIVEGSSSTTWLRAIVLLIGTCIIILLYQLLISRRKGIE